MKRWIKSLVRRVCPRRTVLWSCSRAEPRLVLTFDDGPHRKFTPPILDTLDAFGARATFFVVGKHAQDAPDLARQVVARGHELGLHTQTHVLFDGLSWRRTVEEIDQCRRTIREITGRDVRLLRPTGGLLAWKLLVYCPLKGISLIQWSFDGLDSRGATADAIVARATAPGAVRGGDVLLFHDDNRRLADALPHVLRHFQGLGYRYATVGEVLGVSPPDQKKNASDSPALSHHLSTDTFGRAPKDS